MRYKQPAAVLADLAVKGSAKIRLQAIQLLSQPALPRLGGYASGSPENLLWRIASDTKVPAGKRFIALSQLLVALANQQKRK
jgi:hypothetical protein